MKRNLIGGMDELVVFLMREFGWTLEYTTNLVLTLPLKKLNALIEELKYQKAAENYQIASNFAMIISNWASARSKNKRYKITDFIGEPPRRGSLVEGTGLTEAAHKVGIILPKEGA